MLNSILNTISNIKSGLLNIREKLIKIPEQRTLTYSFEQIEKNPPKCIYKPRFVPSYQLINQTIKTEFVNIIDKINLYLQKYSPDNFVNLKDIIDTNPENKNSIIYLLENDVYKTRYIYGDYLIEKKENHFEINYYRWDRKVISLPDKPLSLNLEVFVKSDAIKQIQTQFDKIWTILENEIDRCENQYIYQLEEREEQDVKLIRQLLSLKECEYLDFKLYMYKLNVEDIKIKLEQRKEFLKDVLGLINNKKIDDNFGKAYILVGVGEIGDKYNGNYSNIKIVNEQILIQILNRCISPTINIEIQEYYIGGVKDIVLLSKENKEGYYRNMLITLIYDIGTVYELKKRIGNPSENVTYYYEGTSFTRDGSHTRRMLQADRERIINLRGGISEWDDSKYGVSELLDESSLPNNEKYLMKTDVIENYIEIIETKDPFHSSFIKILESIERQLMIFIRYPKQNMKFKTSIVKFIDFSLRILEKKGTILSHKFFYLLREISKVPETLTEIKKIGLATLISIYQSGEHEWHLVNLLKNCGYFEDIFKDILNAIDFKDVDLLGIFAGLDFNVQDFNQDKWDMINTLIGRKETLDRDELGNLLAESQRSILYIDRIIDKIE